MIKMTWLLLNCCMTCCFVVLSRWPRWHNHHPTVAYSQHDVIWCFIMLSWWPRWPDRCLTVTYSQHDVTRCFIMLSWWPRWPDRCLTVAWWPRWPNITQLLRTLNMVWIMLHYADLTFARPLYYAMRNIACCRFAAWWHDFRHYAILALASETSSRSVF